MAFKMLCREKESVITDMLLRNIMSPILMVLCVNFGHGIGKDVREDPQVPNYGKRGYGTLERKVFALRLNR